MSPKIISAFCLAHLLLGAVSAPGAVFIDSFETEQELRLEKPKKHKDSSSRIGDEILGGERDVTLRRLAGRGDLVAGVLQDDAGLFSLSADDGVRGLARIIWDGRDRSLNLKKGGLGAFDLTQSDANQKLVFSAISDLGALVTIRVYGNKGRVSEARILVPGSDSFDFYSVNFSDFVSARHGAVRFDRVGAISVEITGLIAGSDAAFGSFAAVPSSFVPVPEAAPLIVGLFGAVLAAVMFIRRS